MNLTAKAYSKFQSYEFIDPNPKKRNTGEMKRALVLSIALAFALVPSKATASLNGSEDYSEPRIVAVSTNPIIGATPWAGGSGYLYSPRIVFSASHLKDHNPSGIFYVSQPNQALKKGMEAVKVIKTFYPERYKPRIYSNDFSVFVLEKPLKQVTSAPLITSELLTKFLAAKTPMKVLGFGAYQDVCLQLHLTAPCQFGSEQTSLVPRSIEMSPASATDIQNKYHQSDPEISDHVFFTGPYKSGPCGGDSGGPTTASINGIDYYVGTVPTGFWNAYACGGSPGYEGDTIGWTAPVYKFKDLISEAEKYVSEHPYIAPKPTPKAKPIKTKTTKKK